MVLGFRASLDRCGDVRSRHAVALRADQINPEVSGATCDQLKAQKSDAGKLRRRRYSAGLLRDDPKARVAFVNQSAAPVSEQDVRIAA